MRPGSGTRPTTVEHVLHPVGPEPRAVYLRRRVAVVGAVVLTLVAVVWIATAIGGGSPGPQPVQAAATGATTTTAGAPSRSPAAGPTDAPTPSAAQTGSPSQTPTAIAPPTTGPQLAACSDDAITVAAQSAHPSYAVGAQPVFRLLITNTGKVACTADLSGALQQFIVYSANGRDRVWSSNDCFPGTAPDTRTLAPADPAVYSIQWAGTSSTQGCKSPRVPTAAGQYIVMGVLGGQQSQPAPFAITKS